MSLKTARQRRVMRKAIKMARAGKGDYAAARFYRVHADVRAARGCARAHRVALDRAYRALDLVATIENVTLTPLEVMMLRALKRAGRRLNARHA